MILRNDEDGSLSASRYPVAVEQDMSQRAVRCCLSTRDYGGCKWQQLVLTPLNAAKWRCSEVAQQGARACPDGHGECLPHDGLQHPPLVAFYFWRAVFRPLPACDLFHRRVAGDDLIRDLESECPRRTELYECPDCKISHAATTRSANPEIALPGTPSEHGTLP